ncbi:hypothetical protein HQ865_24180 [Mucilaginibacter mali]|uniref:Uncharacterized protein n=1 Tax=Mucilaginibacter mali TaxID=2740462 RepID=A0A7D4Q458_9SPHI|nr:hypothetical protein [Mucilaginibacter mali]QKJ32726.1 hypothetical protein HQ865_24180 [Mucilaginibacter mali]
MAAGAYYFFLEKKVAKIQDIGNASLAAHGLCPHQAKPRYARICRCSRTRKSALQANPLPLSGTQASIVLPDLAGSKPLSGTRKVKRLYHKSWYGLFFICA